MARDVATIQVISDSTALNVTYAAFTSANGGQYDNILQTGYMLFRNGATPVTITVSTDKLISPQAVGMTSFTVTLPALAEAFALPVLQNQWWAQDGTTNIYVDTDTDSGVQWAVVRPA